MSRSPNPVWEAVSNQAVVSEHRGRRAALQRVLAIVDGRLTVARRLAQQNAEGAGAWKELIDLRGELLDELHGRR